MTWSIVLMLGLWLGLLLVVQVIQARTGQKIDTCNFKRFTGVPCPTCGTTRAVLALGRGDLSAFRFNPLIASVIASSPIWLTMLWGRRNRSHRSTAVLRSGSAGLIWTLVVAAVAANWAYVIWAGM